MGSVGRSAGWTRALAFAGVLLGAAGCANGDGWESPNYQPANTPPPDTTGTVNGLTVLVSFSDEQIGNTQATKLHRMMNQLGYATDSNAGSVRDYFRDVSGGRLDVQTQVIRVQLDKPKSHYDQAVSDRFVAENANSIEEVTVDGPSTWLLNDVLCKLVTCNGQPPSYQVVSSSTVSAPLTTDFNFASLSTRRLSFWPDHYVRTLTKNSYVVSPGHRDYIDIPNISLYEYINLIYAGKTSRTVNGQGLWPRSVPSIGTVVPGADPAVKLGRFQLQGTLGPSQTPASTTETSIGFVVHETAHTLFDLPDLYDSGDELEFYLDSRRVDSRGVGNHSLMGYTSNPKNLPLLSAPLKDRLGWADVIDISDAAEGTTITLSANGSKVARYCRPGSRTDECYYMEVRSRAAPRGPSGFPLQTPDEGLVIWHAENTKNVLDFVVNNNEDMTPGLHYEVSLVQADGQFELERPGSGASEADDYFRAGRADRFDGQTFPNSNWWDGAPSGLAIRKISAAGSTMTFEIGRRPSSYVHVLTDARVRVNAGASSLPVGQKRVVTFAADSGYRYDVNISGQQNIEQKGLTGTRTIEIQGSLRDTQINVVSYPSTQSAPTQSAEGRVRFALAEGVDVTAFAESGRIWTPGSRVFDAGPGVLTFFPGQRTSPSPTFGSRDNDMIFRTYPGHPTVQVVAKARPGYVLKSLDVYGANHASATLKNAAYARQLSALLTPPAGVTSPSYKVLANAEPIPGYLCREGFVEDWDAEKVYGNVGDKVRYGHHIYASNVPRNFIRANLDANNRLIPSLPYNPENSPTYWTPVASCAYYVENCSSVRKWSLGGQAIPENPATADWNNAGFAVNDFATFNGALYQLVSDPHEVPGAFASRQELLAAHMFSEVRKSLPIYDNRVFVYPRGASWRLIGNCREGEHWQRATIVPSPGVASITAAGLTSVQNHPSEPRFVRNLSGDWSFRFTLDTGYELDDVYVDGRPLGLASTARSATIDYPNSTSVAWAPYIEIKTKCNNGICSGAVVPSVRCELGTPQVWSNGFVYSSVRVTNITNAQIANWSVALQFASPPSLWDSANVRFTVNGNTATFSNAEAWNGALAPGQSYSFSVGGNHSGNFVPPVCMGL